MCMMYQHTRNMIWLCFVYKNFQFLKKIHDVRRSQKKLSYRNSRPPPTRKDGTIRFFPSRHGSIRRAVVGPRSDKEEPARFFFFGFLLATGSARPEISGRNNTHPYLPAAGAAQCARDRDRRRRGQRATRIVVKRYCRRGREDSQACPGGA